MDDSTLISFGIIIKIDLEGIPELKRYIIEHGGEIIYQRKSVDRLLVMREIDACSECLVNARA